jgi:hypothetical protein
MKLSARLFALVVAGLAMTLVTADAAEGPSFDLKATKQTDLVKVNKDGSVFTVQSKMGIGGAVIGLTAGEWPKTVTFVFQFPDGTPLKGMESFKLSTEQFRVEGSMKESGKVPYFVARDGKFEAKGTADVQIKPGKEGLEVTLPANMLKDARKVELSWVDFFRQ